MYGCVLRQINGRNFVAEIKRERFKISFYKCKSVTSVKRYLEVLAVYHAREVKQLSAGVNLGPEALLEPLLCCAQPLGVFEPWS
jgi:hypothetical protein